MNEIIMAIKNLDQKINGTVLNELVYLINHLPLSECHYE